MGLGAGEEELGSPWLAIRALKEGAGIREPG